MNRENGMDSSQQRKRKPLETCRFIRQRRAREACVVAQRAVSAKRRTRDEGLRGRSPVMSFVNRLFSYVFNELMVNALANSKTFQRFAVRSDAMMKEAASGDAMKMMKEGQEYAKRSAEEVRRSVFEEMSGRGKGGGGGT
jgi:hypothetical protein